MKERGMIFNAEMVRAILEGRKTQTRRVMAIQPENSGLGLRRVIDSKNGRDNGKYFWSQSDACGLKARSKVFGCPYGKIGERIWVRETFGWQIRRDPLGGTGEFRVYRATTPDAVRYQTASGEVAPMKWIPSIHMPRRASRITLEITDVRVERLNSITESDAEAEGVTDTGFGYLLVDGFRYLWKSIYGDDSWQANPWVWVIEFKRVEGAAL
ncbi:hypothetical protein HZ504_003183 [Salmonella enterica]|nr:hypothetical protein [Salmonella enterica]EIF8840951.1 hypothetical protein [Salmonella enterica]